MVQQGEPLRSAAAQAPAPRNSSSCCLIFHSCCTFVLRTRTHAVSLLHSCCTQCTPYACLRAWPVQSDAAGRHCLHRARLLCCSALVPSWKCQQFAALPSQPVLEHALDCTPILGLLTSLTILTRFEYLFLQGAFSQLAPLLATLAYHLLNTTMHSAVASTHHSTHAHALKVA